MHIVAGKESPNGYRAGVGLAMVDMSNPSPHHITIR
jgi:hypothetical protein